MIPQGRSLSAEVPISSDVKVKVKPHNKYLPLTLFWFVVSISVISVISIFFLSDSCCAECRTCSNPWGITWWNQPATVNLMKLTAINKRCDHVGATVQCVRVWVCVWVCVCVCVCVLCDREMRWCTLKKVVILSVNRDIKELHTSREVFWDFSSEHRTHRYFWH